MSPSTVLKVGAIYVSCTGCSLYRGQSWHVKVDPANVYVHLLFKINWDGDESNFVSWNCHVNFTSGTWLILNHKYTTMHCKSVNKIVIWLARNVGLPRATVYPILRLENKKSKIITQVMNYELYSVTLIPFVTDICVLIYLTDAVIYTYWWLTVCVIIKNFYIYLDYKFSRICYISITTL